MIEIEIPGRKPLIIETLVVDLNGTITNDGIISHETIEKVALLKQKIRIVMASADTRNNASAVASTLGIEFYRIAPVRECEGKAALLQSIGICTAAAIGNGFNDSLMVKEAALGICVLGREGASPATLMASDIVVTSFEDGLDLLLKPERLIADLRG